MTCGDPCATKNEYPRVSSLNEVSRRGTILDTFESNWAIMMAARSLFQGLPLNSTRCSQSAPSVMVHELRWGFPLLSHSCLAIPGGGRFPSAWERRDEGVGGVSSRETHEMHGMLALTKNQHSMSTDGQICVVLGRIERTRGRSDNQ